MHSILIVTNSEKSIAFFTELLHQNVYESITFIENCGKARRMLLEREFDLCIINAPLADESGIEFAIHVASDGICQVILIVKSELFDEASAGVEEFGVFTVSKPINRSVFWSVLKMATAAYHRLARLKKENSRLVQRLEDIRIITRAKCLLIEYLNMSELAAHKYIEKQAMDLRITKKEVANRILKTYEH